MAKSSKIEKEKAVKVTKPKAEKVAKIVNKQEPTKEEKVFEINTDNASFLRGTLDISKDVKVKRINDLKFMFTGIENGKEVSDEYELLTKEQADTLYSELEAYSKGELTIKKPIILHGPSIFKANNAPIAITEISADKKDIRTKEEEIERKKKITHVAKLFEESFKHIPILNFRPLTENELKEILIGQPHNYKEFGVFTFSINKNDYGYSVTISDGFNSLIVPSEMDKYLPVN